MSASLQIPPTSIEREFLEYWSRTLVDPRDPQNARWLEIELGQVQRGERTAAEIARYRALDGARVLDVGCQTGALAVGLSRAGASVVGVDVDAALVEGARIRARCHDVRATFDVAFAESLPFDRASFDLVTLIDVIEHVADARRTIAECARVLAPGGVLYVQGPNRLSPRWFLRDPHYRMFGISVLPPALGRFYVTRIRRRPRYDVGVFPIGSRVARTLVAQGLRIVASPFDSSSRGLERVRGAVSLRFGSMFTLVACRAA